jgi:hypothetical protein
MDSASSGLCASFLEQSRYYFGTEYRTKLRLAVDALPRDKFCGVRINVQSGEA